MDNTYWYRYFLLCNHLANKMLGHKYQNFAKLILDEDKGRFMNSQMTVYFHQADVFFSELLNNDEGMIFDELSINELAEITPEQLQKDYDNYCNYKLRALDFIQEYN